MYNNNLNHFFNWCMLPYIKWYNTATIFHYAECNKYALPSQIINQVPAVVTDL